MKKRDIKAQLDYAESNLIHQRDMTTWVESDLEDSENDLKEAFDRLNLIKDIAEGAVSGDVVKLAAELSREKSRSLSFKADRDQLKERTENQRAELARLNAVLGHSDETPSPYKERYYKQLDHSERLQAKLSEKTEKLFDLEQVLRQCCGELLGYVDSLTRQRDEAQRHYDDLLVVLESAFATITQVQALIPTLREAGDWAAAAAIVTAITTPPETPEED